MQSDTPAEVRLDAELGTVAESREDGMPASAAERHLRRLLAQRVGMPHTYYDDGEAQGQEHGITIDFMREPVADIDAKLRALNVARAENVFKLPPQVDNEFGHLLTPTVLSGLYIEDAEPSCRDCADNNGTCPHDGHKCGA
jgi:hypothetical protein